MKVLFCEYEASRRLMMEWLARVCVIGSTLETFYINAGPPECVSLTHAEFGNVSATFKSSFSGVIVLVGVVVTYL